MQESFGEYKVLERVGAGAGAEVYRARDTRAGRTAAIKVLTSDVATDPVRGQPIADEAYQAVKLGHPNVAALYAVGEQDGRPYLVYEFIQGQTLTALLGGQAINPRRALEFAIHIADGLADAHALGLVHRALRPEAIIVSQKGTAKITDFGLGLYSTAVASDRARTGAPVPSMAYWAPEQHVGQADHRADIYALGLVLTEMISGRPPAADGSPHDLSLDLSRAPQAAPLVGRMLERDPDRRLDSAATVAGELRQLLIALDAQRDTPTAVTPPAPPRAKPGKQGGQVTAGKVGKTGKRAPAGVVVSKPAPAPSGAAPTSAPAPSSRAAAVPKKRPHLAAPPTVTPVWWIAAAAAGVAGVLWFWFAA